VLSAAAISAHRGPPWIFLGFVGAIVALFICELLIGTDLSFAVQIALTLLAATLTIRVLGPASISGLMIGFMMFTYVGFSQIAKTVLGQPAQTNLAAPDTTVSVILIGTLSICAGALLVDRFLRGRRLLEYRFTTDQLVGLRNLSFIVGGISTAINYQQAGADFTDASYGGIGAIANEFSFFTYLALMADCWAVLTRSDGRRSTSPTVLLQIGALTVYGILSNSKQGTALALVAYLIASIAYRRRVTKWQILVTAASAIVGVIVIYPATQLIRGRASVNHSVAGSADDLLQQFVADPASVMREWDLYRSVPIEQMSVHEQGLFYLGSIDDLVGRFLLIANTDVIVDAVNEKGPYGLDLVTHGFLMAMPTLLLPDKPRINTCDLITWFYGIRPEMDEPSNPTIGIFADCYAAALWPGVVIFPFLMMLIFLPTVQIYGRNISGNLIAAFLFLKYMHIFVEVQLEGYVGYSIRSLPFDAAKIYILIYVANKYFVMNRRDHRLT
jgi:hypothetical protein